MAYDVEQQESISALKAWFEQYANWLIGVSLLALAVVAGNWGWRWYEQRESTAASILYEQYQQAVAAQDSSKARDLAGTLVQQHGSSAYAGLVALAQARASLATATALRPRRNCIGSSTSPATGSGRRWRACAWPAYCSMRRPTRRRLRCCRPTCRRQWQPNFPIVAAICCWRKVRRPRPAPPMRRP